VRVQVIFFGVGRTRWNSHSKSHDSPVHHGSCALKNVLPSLLTIGFVCRASPTALGIVASTPTLNSSIAEARVTNNLTSANWRCHRVRRVSSYWRETSRTVFALANKSASRLAGHRMRMLSTPSSPWFSLEFSLVPKGSKPDRAVNSDDVTVQHDESDVLPGNRSNGEGPPGADSTHIPCADLHGEFSIV
jgi:hypothetical protein